ncbi:MAG: hypothetical protein KAW09_09410 [Thermoplasmata archaeon]|nr:hypothetical protein [Thermoplasmata archaeon]
MEEEQWEDNPFENRPVGKKTAKQEKPPKPAKATPPPPDIEDDNPFERGLEPSSSGPTDNDIGPFENRPSAASYEHAYGEDYADLDEFDKSKLAFISGIGFVALVFVLYFFVFVPGDPLLIGLAIASVIVSALVAFFYLLDDLKIRSSSITERGARFISGIFFMVLIIVLFIPLMMHWPNTQDVDVNILLTLLPIIIMTHGSVALFLYSMLWEE